MHRVSADGSSVPFLPADWAESVLAGPFVAPPYSGAVQDEFAWHLVKYLPETARLQSDVPVEVPTASGPALYTVDFVVEVPTASEPGAPLRRVGFEFSDGRSLRDHDLRLRRDATLLAAGALDTVYRMRGSDLMAQIEDALFLASRWDPDLFSERGRINLRTLSSPEARALRLRPEQPSVLVPYRTDGDDVERELWHIANGRLPHVFLRRLDRRFPDVWRSYAAPLASARIHAMPRRRAA